MRLPDVLGSRPLDCGAGGWVVHSLAGEYSELLYVEQASKDATVLRLSPSPFELWLNTSSADDVGFRSKVQRALGLSPLDTVRVCADHFPTGRPKTDPDAAIAALRRLRMGATDKG